MHDIQILLIFLFNTLNNFTVQLTTMHSLQACYNQSCFSLNLRTVVHYGQEVKSKKFQAYDHGNENQNYYGQDTPPEYRIDVITAPIATYWGDNDWLADPAVSIFFLNIATLFLVDLIIYFSLTMQVIYRQSPVKTPDIKT